MSNLLKSKFIIGLMMVIAFAFVANTTFAAITSTLKFGSRGAQVTELQQALSVSPATGYFGNLTKAAVKAFQANNGLVADGIFGAKSRAALGGSVSGNFPAGCTSASGFSPTTGQACYAIPSTTNLPAGCTSTMGFSPTTGASCATGVVTTNPTGPLAVSLASDNPAAGNIISGQATADLAHFTFTGTGTVTQITLQRTGISNSSSLSNLYLYDGVTRLTDSSTVNTNGVISFNGLNIAVGGSKTVAVKADVTSPLTGSTIAVNLTSYTVLGGTANSVNIAGNTMYIQDGTGLMASAVVAANTVAASSVSAGTMSYTLWSAPVTVSTRAVSLKGASFKFIGSAPATAFANLKLFANGTQIGTSTGVNSLSYVVFDLTNAPFSMNTGSTTLEVRGDVINGSYRDGKLSLESASDLMMTDPQLNINIAATGIPQTTPAGKITILQGSLISQIDTSFNALTNITGGATNATIAKYKLTAYGEDMKVSQIIITPVLASTTVASGANPNGLSNVTLYWNGGQVGSAANVTAGLGTLALTYTLGSNLIVPAGTTGGVLEVRADLQTVGGISYTGGTVTASGSIAIGQAQGVGSNGSAASYQTNASAVTLSATNGLTISTAVLGISASTSYSSQSLSPNQTGVKVASFSVQNQGSSEGLRFTNLAVGLTEGDGATLLTGATTPVLTNFTNLRISETSGVGTIGSPTATNNFPVDFTLASGASKTIDIFADLGADSTNDFVITLLPTLIGASSNVSLTPGAHTDGQVMTLGTGTFNGPSLVVSSSTASQFVAGGSTGATDITKTSFTILATSGTANISELKFSVTGSGVTKIKVGSVIADVIGGIAILPVNIAVPNGQGGVTIDAYASYSPVMGAITSSTASTIALTSVKYVLGGTTTTLAAGSYLANYVSGTLTGTGSATIVFNSTAKLRPGMKIQIFDSTDVDFSNPAIGTVTSVTNTTDAVILKTTASEATGGALANAARFVSVPGNEMTLVGSKPTVTVTSPINGVNTLAAGNVEAIDVKVTADAAGPITVNSFDITSTIAAAGSPLFTAAAATVQNLAGGSIASTGSCASSATCAITVTLTGGYLIGAGQSETFRVFLPVSAIGTVDSPNNSMGTKLVSGATFVWTDTQGGASSTATGALIYSYPASTITVHN